MQSLLESPRGISPSSPSSSSSLRIEASSLRGFIVRMVELLSAPREKGGFGGSLRYSDLGILLPRLGCAWDMERLDDCWYDIVRGRPELFVDDLVWIAKCINDHLHGDAVTFPTREAPSRCLDKEEKMTVLKSEHGPDGVSTSTAPPQSCSQEAQIAEEPHHHDDSDRQQVPQQREEKQIQGQEKLHQGKQRREERHEAARRGRRSRGCSAENSHSATPRNVHFASPTLSSVRRSRSGSVQFRRKNITENSPKLERKASPRVTSGEVFRRLIEDADKRRKKASSPPLPSPPQASSSRKAAGVVAASSATTATSVLVDNNAVGKSEGRSSSTKLIVRHSSPISQTWLKPTESYMAKLAPKPPSVDPLEATEPTPLVERRDPLGPSTYVPPGYVEAVVRLRRFAASRNRYRFADSLRSETFVSTPMGIIEERSPILRLPVPDDGEGKRVVDVRLATPLRSHRFVVSRDLPYDDPSRILIQDVLRGRRVRCRE